MNVRETLFSLKEGHYTILLRGGYKIKFSKVGAVFRVVDRKEDEMVFYSKQDWIVTYGVFPEDVVEVRGVDGKRYI